MVSKNVLYFKIDIYCVRHKVCVPVSLSCALLIKYKRRVYIKL